MHNLTFEDVFPIARGLARQKARTVIGRCGLTPADQEDSEGELLLAFCMAFPKFNARRAPVRTFARRSWRRSATGRTWSIQFCSR